MNCDSPSPVPFDERLADATNGTPDRIRAPAATPVSPCTSEDAPSTAASRPRCRDIEGKYYVDPRVLGRGHVGSVRECVNRATGRRYAVKSILKDTPGFSRGGLAREASLLAGMRHRRVVRLVDAYEDGRYVHLVTDLCIGGELFHRIVERSSDRSDGWACFDEFEAARIMRQILEAVKYLHSRDVVHRDVKPENVLFESTAYDSPVRLIDFGLARVHRRDDPPMSTFLGTPYYVAPEVLAGSYDRSCDLWSAGATAYVLLCGYPPFNGATNAEVYGAIRRGWYAFRSEEWAGTSQEARDFVRRLLERDPRRRMTAEEALLHPWMQKHSEASATMVEDDRQDYASVEVVYQAPSRDSIIVGNCVDKVRIPCLADL